MNPIRRHTEDDRIIRNLIIFIVIGYFINMPFIGYVSLVSFGGRKIGEGKEVVGLPIFEFYVGCRVVGFRLIFRQIEGKIDRFSDQQLKLILISIFGNAEGKCFAGLIYRGRDNLAAAVDTDGRDR